MLSRSNSDRKTIIPSWVLGTEIYEPSRIMRSVQYIWSQNVIRVWNEDILNTWIGDSKIEDKDRNNYDGKRAIDTYNKKL